MIPDSPVEGIREILKLLRKKYVIVVYSARCWQGGKEAIEGWLEKHGLQVDMVVDHKHPAHIYVDDRGVGFNGDWLQCIRDIEAFKHWQEN